MEIKNVSYYSLIYFKVEFDFAAPRIFQRYNYNERNHCCPSGFERILPGIL